jgi:hypothetical protein
VDLSALFDRGMHQMVECTSRVSQERATVMRVTHLGDETDPDGFSAVICDEP